MGRGSSVTMRKTVRLWLAAIGLAGAVAAQTPAAIKTGPEKGQTIPAIQAPDQNGRVQTLGSIAGPKGALLVFYRSADW